MKRKQELIENARQVSSEIKPGRLPTENHYNRGYADALEWVLGFEVDD